MPGRSMCEFVSLAGAYHASLEGIKTNFSARDGRFRKLLPQAVWLGGCKKECRQIPSQTRRKYD